MWKRIGLAALVVAILAGSAAAVIVDNNQSNDGPQQLNQRDGSGNPAGGGNQGGQQDQAGSSPPGGSGGGERGQRQGFEDAEEPVAEDEWISLEGVVTAVSGSMVTIETEAGESIELKLGPSRFLESLDVTFEVGDGLEVSGFYENEAFYAAEITLVDSGEQITLRDADGYLLWNTGGGRQGQGGGNGRSGGGQGNNNGNQ